jgi:hypothetical protein
VVVDFGDGEARRLDKFLTNLTTLRGGDCTVHTIPGGLMGGTRI